MVSSCVNVEEQTDIAEVRRVALALASELQFDETQAGKTGLVVTEAAKNLLKHAGRGQMILRRLDCGFTAGIEMLALDKGPGIANVQKCFEDGYSTAGTAGTGLGAIARLSNVHEIYSRRQEGTAVMAQVWRRPEPGTPPRHPRFEQGGVCVAFPGEQECGDGWVFQESARGARLMLADGLGHGAHAAHAAQAAIHAAGAQPNEAGPAVLERVHGALRATRGAAVAVADIDLAPQVVRFTGIGNIAAVVVPESGPVRHLVSHAGTVGHHVSRMLEFTYPWHSGALLLMHSDGLQTHWSLDAYPGLRGRHPSLIAGVLYRDYTRGRDDVTVVVAREANREV